MTKQEQLLVISTIDNIINEKTTKLSEEKLKLMDDLKLLKEKNNELIKENKETKQKVKELEKQNSLLGKEILKYEKIFSNIKSAT